ncbi:MAG TPA: tail fiber domain-containing protein, partial [Casimicrobiaceae bacterium]|nr:tail fiber domain-containing protein [Casimicrobiaceae bacterium]
VASLNFNTVSTAAKINTSNKQIGVQVRGGGAHLAIDVVGYFGAPSGNGGKFFQQGGNAFGTAASLGTTDNQPLALLANGQPAMTYLPNATSPNIVGGHASNSVDSSLSGQTIAGGGFAGDNCFDSATNTSARSCLNTTTGNDASIGGGASNMALGDAASVAGGFGNTAAGIAATVAGGGGNTASGNHATVGGGRGNNASGHRATVVGGEDNVADHDSATVLGGRLNQAAAAVSVAAGEAAIAMHTKSFVWDAWNSGSATSFRSNAFQIHGENGLDIEYGTRRADGGGTSWVFIGNAFPGQAIATSTGAFLSTGGTWVPSSDRARKTSVLPIDPAAVLEAVMQVPITSWQYKVEDPGIRHIGPMAQDFYRAFGFGYNDKSIATIDADGVALAAIQGLRKLLLEKDAEIDGQRREIVALKERMVEVDAIREDLAKLRGALADMQQVPASP